MQRFLTTVELSRLYNIGPHVCYAALKSLNELVPDAFVSSGFALFAATDVRRHLSSLSSRISAAAFKQAEENCSLLEASSGAQQTTMIDIR